MSQIFKASAVLFLAIIVAIVTGHILFEYCISRPMNGWLQLLATVLWILALLWLLFAGQKLLTKIINKK